MKKYSILLLIFFFLQSTSAQVLFSPVKHHIDKVDELKYPSAGDLDGDGTDELVVTGQTIEGFHASIFDIATDGTISYLKKLEVDYGSFFAHFVDMDNDGDTDLVIPGMEKILWYENDGTGEILPEEIELNVGFDFRGSYAEFFDFDNDGDLDLLGQNLTRHQILENVNGNFTFYQNLELPEENYAHQIIDLDGDGDLDLITSGGLPKQVYFSYNEDGVFSTPIIVAALPEEYDELKFAVGDLDGDGDLDLGFAGAGTRGVLLAYNEGSNSIFSNTEIFLFSNTTSKSSDVQFIDIDGDADLDVFVGGSYNSLHKKGWLRNDSGTMTQMIEPLADSPGAGWSYFVPAEIDTNTNEKLIAVSGRSAHNRIYTIEYDNTPDSIYILNQYEDANNQINKIFLADMDLDGDKDFISIAKNSKYLNWFKTELPDIDYQIFSDTNILPIALFCPLRFAKSADLNGDNYPDIILSRTPMYLLSQQPSSTLIYFFQPATNDFSEATILEDYHSWGATIFDADGDGDMDILSNLDEGYSLYLNTDGHGNFSTATPILSDYINSNPYINYNRSTSIDLENDGDLDLVLYSQKVVAEEMVNELVLLKNDGQANFSPPILIHSFPDSSYSLSISMKRADMNGDGLDDIIYSANGENLPDWFARTGIFYNLANSNQFSTPTTIAKDYSSAPPSWNLPLTEDIDLDGDLDLIYQSYSGVQWQENIDNSSLFSSHTTLPPNTPSYPNPIPNPNLDPNIKYNFGILEGLQDMDDDGDLDFIFNAGYEIYWTENTAIHQYFLEGNLTADTTLNCAADADEFKIADWIIVATQDQTQVAVFTDSLGHYSLPVDSGEWIVSVVPKSNSWTPCFTDSLVIMPTTGATIKTDFFVQPNGECDFITLEVSDMGILRPCQVNTTSIKICNYGPEPAEDILLEVVLDSLLYFDSASTPFSVDADSTIYLEVGSLEFNECRTVTMQTHLTCEMATPLDLKCMKFQLLSEELCAPNDTLWDGSIITVNGTCVGDSIFFTLQNIGTNAMSSPAEHRVEIINDDIVMLFQVNNYQLGAQEMMELKFEVQGMGMRLSADQTNNNPVTNEAMITVPNCNDVANNVVLNLMPMNNGNPFITTSCKPVVTSYDPNDKIAFPKGIGSENNIQRNWELDYTIRFQNTGNDTAFVVVLRDTLSEHLDLATLKVGGSSHPFTYKLNAERELAITFANILLVDSLTNPAGSQGFVEYSILPKATVPFGSVIENTAKIYFDYNDPITTNTVFHTIQKPVVSTVEHLEGCSDMMYAANTVLMNETIFAEYDSIHFTYIRLFPTYEIDTIVNVAMGTTYEGVLINSDTSFSQNYTTPEGCDSLVHFQFSILTNTTSPSFQHLKIFPNPVSDQLNILENENTEAQNWRLVNATGQTVWNKSLEKNEAMKTISMKDFPVGVYWLEVKTAVGFGAWKIVKLE